MIKENSTEYKYWAFISYSHQDNIVTRGDGSGDHIPWTNWLHEQLETFRVPDGYRDRPASTGEPMPERFFPVFRDEAELPTSHDLGGQIHDALRRSRFLIVIASPRSAASRYVNEEVRYFRQLGRGNRILTLIVDGEPNVRLHPKAGWTAGDDCFCPTLVHPLRDDGSMDETAFLPEEPIAADVRIKESEPPREMRASERVHSNRQGLLDFMKLKLIAGLMGVGLDELVQRDKRRAEEQLKRSQQELSRTEFLFARQLLDLKDYPQAYARLSKSLADDPENRAAAILGLEEIRRSNRGTLRQYIHDGTVNSAVFSPDGLLILTASDDKTARLWDTATGCPLAGSLVHEYPVLFALFSPNGLLILTTSADKTVRLWDVATGSPRAKPMCHESIVNCALFSPNGMRILTASGENDEPGCAWLWDVATGRPLAEPLRHEGGVHSAVFNPDGARILTSSYDNAARLWDAATGRPLTDPLRHEKTVNSAVFSPDGTRILTTSWDNTVRLWDAATGRPLTDPLRHEKSVNSAVFSPDGTRILTASADKTARIWDAANGCSLAEPLRHEMEVNFSVFSPDGVFILTATGNYDNPGYARIWTSFGHPVTEPLRHEGGVRSAVFSPDGARILTSSYDNAARLWDVAANLPLAEPLRHEGEVTFSVFSPDSTRILTASVDNTARLWDAATGRPLAEPLSHERWVCSAVFSPDGASILTASADKTARLWDAVTGHPLADPMHHGDSVNSAVFSPDGTRIMTASADKTVRLWDVATGRTLVDILIQNGMLNSAVFSPDGLCVVTASGVCLKRTSVALIWDAATGRQITEPMRHEAGVNSAVFSPDGVRILTASGNFNNNCGFAARLWDAATGHPIAEALRHAKGVHSAVFSPDGTCILTASADNTARLWDAATGELLAEDCIRLRTLLEIAGTSSLNCHGITDPVPPDEIERLRCDLNCGINIDEMFLWWWADPFSRTIHPTSSITVPEFIRRRIKEALECSDSSVKDSALKDALDAFPHHPLVLLCFALEGDYGDPAWLAQYAVSRLLAEPHYLKPLQSRMTEADRAARAYELKEGLAEDCFLAARLLQRQNRLELAKQCIARSRRLCPDNEDYRKLQI